MKKLLLLFSLFIAFLMSAQTPSFPITTANNLKITAPVLGNKHDSLLVYRGTTDKIVRFLPISQLSGSQNLDEVLSVGNTSNSNINLINGGSSALFSASGVSSTYGNNVSSMSTIGIYSSQLVGNKNAGFNFNDGLFVHSSTNTDGTGYIKSSNLDTDEAFELVAPGGVLATREWVSSNSAKTILVTDEDQLVNQTLQSDVVYILENSITLNPGESIIVPPGGLTLRGYGFNISKIFTSTASANVFSSPVGGSGDLVLAELEITNVGTGSKTFNIKDSDGTHAIEIEYVNFSGCKSLGKLDGYRQGTFTTVGLYGCADGMQLSGIWSGFKITNTNIFSFGSTGTLFKKDSNTSFSNRLFININADFPTGSLLTDFNGSNFTANELLQINSSIVKVNGVINSDVANTIMPNITANDLKSLWIGNIGLPDSAQENFVDTNVASTYEIDWLKDTYFLTMTANTTFTEKNLPANGKNTAEIKLYIQGNFIPTFPSGWLANAVGTYKGTDVNEVTLKFIKTGVYFMKIANTLSIYPKPSLQSLLPTSLLPSNTQQLTINGSFFTPETIVSIENQTVNSIEFVNQGQLILSVTTSSVEEEVDITISNGTSVVFSGVLPINLGVVFIPTEANWSNIVGDLNVTETGNAKIITLGAPASGTWGQEFDYTKDFIVKFGVKQSTLGSAQGGFDEAIVDFLKVDNSILFNVFYYGRVDSNRADFYGIPKYGRVADWDWGLFKNNTQNYWDTPNTDIIEIRVIDGIVSAYFNNVYRFRYDVSLTGNIKMKVNLRRFDIVGIKYIELP